MISKASVIFEGTTGSRQTLPNFEQSYRPTFSNSSCPRQTLSNFQQSSRPSFNNSSCSRQTLLNFQHASPRPSFSSRPVQRPSWMNEGFNRRSKKTKKKRLIMWEHEFICLAKIGEESPPTPMEKAELIRAGLGPRKLSLFEYGDSSEFHESILSAFPKLNDGGGYELLRTVPSNTKKLCVIPSPPGGHTVEYIKNIVSQAKIYIRPIQKSLSLDMKWDENQVLVTLLVLFISPFHVV